MRYTGNAAKRMLVAAASVAYMSHEARRYIEQQYRKIDAREKRRQFRMRSNPVGESLRANADERRQRRAAKRYQDYLRCLANNPCLNRAAA